MKKTNTGYWLLCCLLLWAGCHAYSQDFAGPADSLQNILKKKLPDTVRVDAWNALSAELHGSDYAGALKAARQAAGLARSVGYPFGEAKAYQNIALTSWANGFYADALTHHHRAIDMFVEIGAEEEMPEAYNKLGLVYYYIAEYDKAVAHLEKSIQLFRQRSDTVNLARVLNNLGLLHDTRGEYGLSTQYIFEGVQLNLNFSQLRDQQWRTYSRNLIHENEYINRQILDGKLGEIKVLRSKGVTERLANLQVEVGEAYFFLKEFENALRYYEEAERSYGILENPVLVAHCLRDQAKCYSALGDYGQALDLSEKASATYYEKKNFIRLSAVEVEKAEILVKQEKTEEALRQYFRCITLQDTLGHKAALSRTKTKVAGVLLGQQRSGEALQIAEESYSLAREIGSLTRVEGAARQLYLIYKQMGQYAEGLKYLEESDSLRKVFDNELTNRQIAELQIRYETTEKQKEIDQLNQIADLNASVLGLQKQMIVLLSLSLLAFVVLLVFVNGRLRKIRSLNRTLDEHQTQILDQNHVLEKRGREKELLISEIHHRVKNNLQIISSLLRLQQHNIADESARAAIFEGQNRVQSMSLLHQRLYQQGSYESVDLKSYTNDIFDHLLKVYQVGRNDMDLLVTCDDVTLDVDTAVTFGLIINEVYSNIFKHASSQGRRLVIGFDAHFHYGEVAVKVTDNGPGFPEAVKKGQMGFGLSLVRMMVGELNGHVTFESNPDGGAMVTIAFPSHDSGAAR